LLTACSTQVTDDDGTDQVVDRDARDSDVNVNVYDNDNRGPVVVNNTTTVYRDNYYPVVVDDDDDTTVIIRDSDDTTVVWQSGEQERNEDIARDFIESTATYRSDGSDLELVDAQKLSTNPPLLVYDFTYTSEGEGYGDRDGTVGEQTEHRVRVIIMNGEIVSAINDGIWNELTRSPVRQGGVHAEGEFCDDDATCEGDLYCFRMSDGDDAQGICIEEA
jgi:hypothetical protein